MWSPAWLDRYRIMPDDMGRFTLDQYNELCDYARAQDRAVKIANAKGGV